MSTTLTEYQKAGLGLWTRTQMIEFLMKEGLRGPRRSLRGKPLDWLMRGCVEDENCQQKAEEEEENDCDHCPQHCP